MTGFCRLLWLLFLPPYHQETALCIMRTHPPPSPQFYLCSICSPSCSQPWKTGLGVTIRCFRNSRVSNPPWPGTAWRGGLQHVNSTLIKVRYFKQETVMIIRLPVPTLCITTFATLEETGLLSTRFTSHHCINLCSNSFLDRKILYCRQQSCGVRGCSYKGFHWISVWVKESLMHLRWSCRPVKNSGAVNAGAY